jgi:hypothetical protein
MTRHRPTRGCGTLSTIDAHFGAGVPKFTCRGLARALRSRGATALTLPDLDLHPTAMTDFLPR